MSLNLISNVDIEVALGTKLAKIKGQQKNLPGLGDYSEKKIMIE